MSAIERNTPALGVLRTAEAAPEVPAAYGTSPTGGTRGRIRLGGWARIVSPIALLVIWQLTHVLKLISVAKLPPPTNVASTAWQLITAPTPAFGSLQGALGVSCERFAIGFALGGTVAVLFALSAGLSRLGEVTIDPLLQMLRTVPLFGLIPVFIVWFGIGQLPKVLLIAIAATIPLYLNTYAGIRSIDGRLYELGRVVGLNRREFLVNIVLPGALPQALVGLRQSLGAAWLALVVAEQIAANRGLGFMINQAAAFLRNDVIFVVLFVYTMLGLLTDWIVRIFERRALAWRTDLVIV